jgi:16S rRNA (guanine527-N7)-methyltransferase
VKPAGFSSSLQARLAGSGLALEADQLTQLERYWQLLEHWNSRINLTALPLRGFPTQSLDRLIVEPLLARPLFDAGVATWFDLGSGGGSPALPLKLVLPQTRLVMVESRSRKVAFLREAVRSLGLNTAEVVTSRFQELERPNPPADYVTARAVRPDEDFAAVAAHLLGPHGRLILFGRAARPPAVSAFELSRQVDAPNDVAIRSYVPRGTQHD